MPPKSESPDDARPCTCGALAQPVASAKELRCECGCLLARRTPQGIELKCRRCKNYVVIDAAE